MGEGLSFVRAALNTSVVVRQGTVLTVHVAETVWNPATERHYMRSMFSVPAFLAEHGISRSLFYRLLKEGRGPRITKIGERTLVSAEAAAEWRSRMERETEQAGLKARRGAGKVASNFREAA
jgi:predicted DNA-binding transcriptional regulator AlpA